MRDCLICFALPHEARFFSLPARLRERVEVLITGVGPDNARRATETALAQARPDRVLTCGFAGALRPGLPAGTLLFSEDEGLGLAPALSELGAIPGSFHCSHRIAVTRAEKNDLWQATGADAVEMESGIIRELCRARQVRSATVRVISDTAEEDLPLDFNLLTTANQQLHYGKLALALGKSPWKIAALCRFQRQISRAARRLGEALEELLRRDAFAARGLQER